MQQVEIIIYQIVVLGLLGLTGFIAGKMRYIPEESGVVLSGIVVKLTAPFLIFTTMTNYSFTSKMLLDGIFIYVAGIVFILFSYVAAYFSCSILKVREPQSNIYKMEAMFGNVIFLAFPILSSLFGEKGILYAVFFNLANDSVLWTLGIYLVNRHNTTRWKDNLKHLVNGNTVAFSAGLIFILFNLHEYTVSIPLANKIYSLFYNTFYPLGKTTIYLSMIFIGIILAKVKIRGYSDIKARFPIFVLSMFKLLIVPVIAFCVLSLFGRFIDSFTLKIVVLQLAMPCGTIVAALAAQYDSDYEFATECVFVSTLLGAVTLPFIVFLLL